MRTVRLPPIELSGAGGGTDRPGVPPLDTSTQLRDPEVNVGDAPPVAVDPVAQRRVLMSLQPPDPMQDPAFRAYVARQAQAQAELKAAQQEAAATRGSTGFQVGNALVGLGAGLQGRSGADLIQARTDAAGQPVRDVLQRQEAGRAGTKGAQEETALGGQMLSSRLARESSTPGSAISKAHAMLALHQGLIKPEDVGTYTASMDDTLHKGGTIQAAREKAQAEIAIHKDHLSLERDKLAEEVRYHNIIGQKDLPPSTVTELESALAGVKALDDVRAKRSDSGLVDKTLSLFGAGDFAQTKNAAAAEVAKADSKGRVNPTGAIKEAGQMPGPLRAGGDSYYAQKRKELLDAAEQKLNVLAAGRVRPEQVAEYRRQLDSLKAGSAPGGGSSADTVDVVSPEGVPGKVPAGKLDAALAKGFKRAGGAAP